MLQSNIGENDVGRDVSLITQAFAQLPQTVEQHFIARDFTCARRGLLHFDGFHRACQCNLPPLPERGPAFIGQLQRAELFSRLPQKAEPNQFPSNRSPFRAIVLAADSVGGKLLMSPAAESIGIRSCEHFDHMIEAHAKARFLAYPIDA